MFSITKQVDMPELWSVILFSSSHLSHVRCKHLYLKGLVLLGKDNHFYYGNGVVVEMVKYFRKLLMNTTSWLDACKLLACMHNKKRSSA